VTHSVFSSHSQTWAGMRFRTLLPGLLIRVECPIQSRTTASGTGSFRTIANPECSHRLAVRPRGREKVLLRVSARATSPSLALCGHLQLQIAGENQFTASNVGAAAATRHQWICDFSCKLRAPIQYIGFFKVSVCSTNCLLCQKCFEHCEQAVMIFFRLKTMYKSMNLSRFQPV
jgi:hypothetical protein